MSETGAIPTDDLGEVITSSVTVYTLDELEALDAREGVPPRRRERAIGNMVGKLNDWWDQSDTDSVSDTIVYALADAFKAPGWDTFGEADFPGIDGVKLDGWDLDRGQHIFLDGTLTRENAPALPWVDGIDSVTLEAHRDHTSIWLVMADEVNFGDDDSPVAVVGEEASGAMREAVDDAMHAAWKAGRDESEYHTGEEYAAETADANGYRFLEDGTFYG